MEALAHNKLTTKERDTFYKAKRNVCWYEIWRQSKWLYEPYELDFKGKKDIGSNDDDKFIFNLHDIDAKSWHRHATFTQNVDLS